MIPELILLAIIIGYIFKGKLERIADVDIRHSWMIFAPAVCYIFAKGFQIYFPYNNFSEIIYSITHLVGTFMLLFMVLCNLHISGAKLIALGLILNIFAISANSGFMPVSKEAIELVYGSEHLNKALVDEQIRSSFVDDATKLKIFTDIIPLPRPYVLIPAVYSIGDFLMSFGLVVAIVKLMKRKNSNSDNAKSILENE
ncbi:MAG: DUF5317 domain-containing protein [Armatimonadota bacterium]